jgi:crossover junction endodeoxyribonuclease RuvC
MGIDPGKSGGIAILEGGAVMRLLPMPLAGRGVDFGVVAHVISAYRPDAIVMEKVGAMPKQGVVSTFTFGVGYGGIQGVCAALGAPLHLVTPQAWKQLVLAGTAKDKSSAIAFVRRAYPQADLMATPRSRVPHDGLADAVCLATYGLRVLAKP